MARAGGETAPLLLTALGNQFFNVNLLEPIAACQSRSTTMPSRPMRTGTPRPGASALVLIVLIGCLSLLLRLALHARTVRGS